MLFADIRLVLRFIISFAWLIGNEMAYFVYCNEVNNLESAWDIVF